MKNVLGCLVYVCTQCGPIFCLFNCWLLWLSPIFSSQPPVSYLRRCLPEVVFVYILLQYLLRRTRQVGWMLGDLRRSRGTPPLFEVWLPLFADELRGKEDHWQINSITALEHNAAAGSANELSPAQETEPNWCPVQKRPGRREPRGWHHCFSLGAQWSWLWWFITTKLSLVMVD